jgi:cytochrome b561
MLFRNTTDAWGPVAKGMHWLMAVLVIGLWLLGTYMTGLHPSPPRARLYAFHETIGLTIFGLALVRLAWRLASPTPRLPASLLRPERILARTSHAALYLLILLVPVTGFIRVQKAPDMSPILLLGRWPLPALLGPGPAAAGFFSALHQSLTNFLAILIVLHIVAALKHHLEGDDVLRRMLPGLGRRGRP